MQLQEKIRKNPLADNSTPEILIDNDDKSAVTIDGDWYLQKDTYRSYGTAANFLVNNSKSTSPKSVKYTPSIKVEGKYDVYLYFPILDNGSTLTTIKVYEGTTVIEKVIKKADIVVEGQTAGEWVHLGEYYLAKGKNAYVEISNDKADNAVAADAVLFLPSR